MLVTPPFVQLNTAYPATTMLKGFLNQQGFVSEQFDLSIETFLSVFSKEGLTEIFEKVKNNQTKKYSASKKILKRQADYISLIEPVIAFLQGKSDSIVDWLSENDFPKGQRIASSPDVDWLFEPDEYIDKAKYLSTLFIEDIGDFIIENIDENFGFSRYAERIGLRATDFHKIEKQLQNESIVTNKMLELLNEKIKQVIPKVIGFTIPFPGNLFSVLKSAKFIKENYPEIKVVFGGGFVNTELRELSEKRLFNYIDFLCLDDGELPLLNLLKYLLKNESKEHFVRTFCFENNEIKYFNNSELKDFKHNEIGTQDFSGLPIEDYVSFLEIANPMHRLWSDGWWNKMILAHGCYWHKCSFCDTSLDYIKRYSQADANILCNRIEAIIQQTNKRTFHFVDEAASPKVLQDLANELIKRKIEINWWTNIRFEKSFTPELCNLLAKSGCIAVSGGLEVASDRLLEMMNKGVSIEQVAKVTKNLSDAGIMVHAYLMYGFPTQTKQETIDSLEIVRQLFENDLIQSAFWHRFAMTVHSPIGINPEQFNVKRIEVESTFAKNDCDHEDPQGCNHNMFSFGLKKALYNYMHGQCFDFDLQEWFDFKIPRTKYLPKLIAEFIK